ncbi:uncharacterized protein VTP21DRAFT_169 [Calcarisporiella thermophila]|uniref:uncharacterized protein n=1 Tax=Calcarisporiella thermophila TaxID=911321 RepID=UPI003744635F
MVDFGQRLPPPPDQTQLSGYLSSLTPEQTDKLAELWLLVFRLYTAQLIDPEERPSSSSFFGFFAREEAPYRYVDDEGEPLFHDVSQMLHDVSPEELRASAWGAIMHDPPDSILLRFLRARKWDVRLALRMMCSTVLWRHRERILDLVERGDSGMEKLYEERGERGWRFQWTSGKSYFFGLDRWSRPICIINVRLHFKRDQDDEPMKKFTVLQIESARKMLTPPGETACVIFNMTGFTLANLDLAFVRYLIQCFEAYYPECLGACLIHNAPWIFEPCWRMIRPWLDPVVAAKIRFTYGVEGLADYVEPSQLQEEFGGTNPFKWEYIPPRGGENQLMQDTRAKKELLEKEERLRREFEQVTREWAEARLWKNVEKAEQLWQKRKEELNPKLRQIALDLDPYIRGRVVYHRYGFITPEQTVNFSANLSGDNGTAAPAIHASPGEAITPAASAAAVADA